MQNLLINDSRQLVNQLKLYLNCLHMDHLTRLCQNKTRCYYISVKESTTHYFITKTSNHRALDRQITVHNKHLRASVHKLILHQTKVHNPKIQCSLYESFSLGQYKLSCRK